MHWKVQVIFDKTAEVHMHMKGSCTAPTFGIPSISLMRTTGSRDPYEVNGNGAGFVVCWSGNPRLRIGYDNPEKELMQIESDEMLFAIPECVPLVVRLIRITDCPPSLEAYNPRISHERDDISIASYRVASRKYRKIVSIFLTGQLTSLTYITVCEVGRGNQIRHRRQTRACLRI
jgi:hypothetical protein